MSLTVSLYEAKTQLSSLVEQASAGEEIPVSGAVAEAAGALDWNHADPFDRMIVTQAQARRLTLITADAAVQRFIGVAMVAAG